MESIIELNKTIETLKETIENKNRTINKLNEQNIGYYKKLDDYTKKLQTYKVEDVKVNKFFAPLPEYYTKIAYVCLGVWIAWAVMVL